MSNRIDSKAVVVWGGMWEIPTMREVNEAKIDAKNRTSALTGLVKPGERYAISHVAPGKLVFTRMVEEKHEPAKVWLVRENGRMVIDSERPITMEEVERAMEEFQ